jgi:CBS domain-containing protein
MQVRDGMSTVVLTIGPQHTLRDAARLMSERNVGAAVVIDPDSPGIGIFTERDLMVRGGFRHLIVTEGGDIAGVLSVRDVVRCWTDDGAICDVPESAQLAS